MSVIDFELAFERREDLKGDRGQFTLDSLYR